MHKDASVVTTTKIESRENNHELCHSLVIAVVLEESCLTTSCPTWASQVLI